MALLGSTTASQLVADISNATGTTFNSIYPVVYIVVGIGLAFYIVKKVISLFPKK